MSISKKELSLMFNAVAALWRENMPLLGEIDSRFGDGDHGVTIGKIADCIDKSLAEWTSAGMKEYIDDLSTRIMGVNGGSAGPLYGTLFEGLAAPLPPGTTAIDAPLLKRMIAGARDALFEISKARVGGKTMMDALIPAAEAAGQAEGGIAAVLAAAAAAAKNGADATKDMVSRFGRARSYGEQTLGTADAGAVSAALLFAGLDAGAKQRESE